MSYQVGQKNFSSTLKPHGSAKMEFLLDFDSICFKMGMRHQNHPWVAFGVIGMDWSVVRPPRLLSRIAMDPRMSTKNYFAIPSHLKIFFRDFKVKPLIPQGLILPYFALKMGIKLQKCTLKCVLKCRNRLRRRATFSIAFADSFDPKDVRENL